MGCWHAVPNHWGDGEPLSPEEHGDTPGSQMSGTTEILGDPEILTNDCTAPMGIAFPTAMIVPAPNVALISRMTIDGIPQRPAWLELKCRRGGVERDRGRPHGPSKLGPPEWRSPPRRWSDSPPSPSRGSLTPRTLGTSLLQCWFIHGQDADRSESQREILATSSMRSVLS